jgi:hypothetical protein
VTKPIKTETHARACGALAKEIEEELKLPDPSPAKATAALEKNVIGAYKPREAQPNHGQ